MPDPIRSLRAYRQHIKPPSGVDPLVRRLFEIMHSEQMGYADLAERSGVGMSTLVNWRTRNAPLVPVMQAALNALGYALVIRRIDED